MQRNGHARAGVGRRPSHDLTTTPEPGPAGYRQPIVADGTAFLAIPTAP
jgi:hypothetical protein